MIRLVSLGPDLDMDSDGRNRSNHSDYIDNSINTCNENKSEPQSNSSKNRNDSKNSVNDSVNSVSNSIISIEKNNKNKTDKTRIRILSVEQKMLRTAEQKLNAERLILADGVFDMGTASMDGTGVPKG